MKIIYFLRSLMFYLGFYSAAILFGCIIAPLIMKRSFDFRLKVLSQWCRFSLWWLSISCGVKHVVIGKENIPKQQPFIVISNHQSNWETFFFLLLFYPCCFVVKRELFKIPAFGWGLKALEPIAIDRASPREAAKQTIKKGLARLKRQHNIVVFPEGTRLKPGIQKKFARGGGTLAKNAEVYALPVAHNAGVCWPSKGFLKYPGCITVTIGQPITDIENLTSKEITEQAESWIYQQKIK